MRGRGGGGVRNHRPKPPPRSEAQPPLTRSQEAKGFVRVVKQKRRQGDPPAQKAQPPPPTHTARPTKAVNATKPTNPPKTATANPPPTETDTPKGAEKKDDRPGDPIVGTVVPLPYPDGVERGTVRGIHGRKYGAVWVEYLGGTTLYEVNRSLLFPTHKEAKRHREEAQGAGTKKSKTPTPTNEASNSPNANPTTEPNNPTNPPSGPAKMLDPTTGCHEV